MNRMDVDPMVFLKDLEATHLILEKDGEEGGIGVLCCGGHFWVSACCMIVVSKKAHSINTSQVGQMVSPKS